MPGETGDKTTRLARAIGALDAASIALTDALAKALAGEEGAEAAGNAEPSALMLAWSDREAAFATVQAAAAAGERPGPADRARLEQVRLRDEAWIAQGGEAAQLLSSARLDLGRRRNAATAHQMRARETPRFVAVKA